MARAKGGSRLRELHARYDEWTARHPRAADDFASAIRELLSDAGLAFDSVTARVKTWRSLRIKAMRRGDDGEFAYPEPWTDIHDLVGVRVTAYHSNEIPDVLAVLGDSLEVLRAIDKTAETRISGQFGYGSHHLVCRVGEDAPPGLAPYRGQKFEVQVRTVLQHAWAEFEHDIRYKSPDGAIDPRIDRAFALAAGLIELADQQFDQVAAILDEERGEERGDGADAVELGAETLPGLLTLLLPTVPRSKSEHYAWLEELLDANGVATVGDLRDLVAPERVAAVEEALNYRFQPGHVRIIDDLLLAAFGADHVTRTGKSGAHPAQRPARLRSRLAQMRKAGIVG
ncbi:GTP pyrophosphokinase family protein [uncultured Corynebacterium sp.]|uniref:GTP pyrophosphokinase n=1 Tax=uncultured Corynebacterium sp. TaxID=159447 RepID=UPI00261BE651|nr:GTP pyrophosphokinase family protein [uncultured Corynebacterium sp.]